VLGNNAIKTITVRGFKGIRELENLELRPLNVLIGANGAGKSNFLGVFELLRAAFEGRMVNYVAQSGGAENLLHFGSKVTQALTVAMDLQGTWGRFELELVPSVGDQLILTQRIDPPGLRSIPVYATIPRLQLFHFADAGESSPMRKTGEVDDNVFLRASGSNLAPILYFIQERHPESIRQIRRVVRQVAPFFDDFLLQPLLLNPKKIRLQWRHLGSENHFFAESLSDGTIRFIALATLLFLPDAIRPPVILLDEPELGLHPAAITLLAALLRKASVDTQVIVSTQSPQLLDEFEPENVLVMDRLDGATQVRRLEAEPLAEWLEDYSLGQLWQKNRLGGRPVSTSR
jgi:predicted ATPase